LNLEILRQIVIADPALTEQLAAIASERELVIAVKALARQHGFTLDDDELAAAARANLRLWLERWTRQ
jgi:hypothetical protein